MRRQRRSDRFSGRGRRLGFKASPPTHLDQPLLDCARAGDWEPGEARTPSAHWRSTRQRCLLGSLSRVGLVLVSGTFAVIALECVTTDRAKGSGSFLGVADGVAGADSFGPHPVLRKSCSKSRGFPRARGGALPGYPAQCFPGCRACTSSSDSSRSRGSKWTCVPMRVAKGLSERPASR